MPLLRLILAPIAGILVALCLIALIESLSHRIFPPPAGLDFRNPEVVRAYVASMPTGAFLLVLTGWVAGVFGGILAASLIGRAHLGRLAAAIGGIILAATLGNLIMIPHPIWFSTIALLAIPAAAYAAWKTSTRLVPTTARSPGTR